MSDLTWRFKGPLLYRCPPRPARAPSAPSPRPPVPRHRRARRAHSAGRRTAYAGRPTLTERRVSGVGCRVSGPLRSWRIHFRQIGHEIGRAGMPDQEVISLLRRTGRGTLFTRDLRFYDAKNRALQYCIVSLGGRTARSGGVRTQGASPLRAEHSSKAKRQDRLSCPQFSWIGHGTGAIPMDEEWRGSILRRPIATGEGRSREKGCWLLRRWVVGRWNQQRSNEEPTNQQPS
jgi:hypothetical protein